MSVIDDLKKQIQSLTIKHQQLDERIRINQNTSKATDSKQRIVISDVDKLKNKKSPQAITNITNNTIVQGVLKTAYAKYDYYNDGGWHGTIVPKINAMIPQGAVVVGVSFHVVEAFDSEADNTISIGTLAGSTDDSLLGATDVSAFTTDAVFIGTPNTAPFKMTAAGNITITIT